jgi:hypothetical protein
LRPLSLNDFFDLKVIDDSGCFVCLDNEALFVLHVKFAIKSVRITIIEATLPTYYQSLLPKLFGASNQLTSRCFKKLLLERTWDELATSELFGALPEIPDYFQSPTKYVNFWTTYLLEESRAALIKNLD